MDKPPAPEIVALIADADSIGVPINEILGRVGVAQSTWWRWTTAQADPVTPAYRKVREALDAEIRERAA